MSLALVILLDILMGVIGVCMVGAVAITLFLIIAIIRDKR